MAAGDKYLECGAVGKDLHEASGVEEILNAIMVQTAAGQVGFRTVVTTTDGGNITPMIPCSDMNQSLENILRRILVEDVDGKPAIGLIVAT